MSRRPNFVLFITDQHRADHLGCYGNGIVRTPHIDSIAARGVRFNRFYVASPVCMPNRASLMTGRMPSLHGVRGNGIPLSVEDTTFVDLLRAAGYRTALTGKSHLQNFTGSPPMLTYGVREGLTPPPPELREASRHMRTGRAYDNENPKLWTDDPTFAAIEPFYGFEHTRICTEHADRVGGHYTRWLAERHTDPDSLRGPGNALPDNRIDSPQAWRTRMPEELYPTTYVAEMAEKFLDRHADEDREAPFFIQVSFPDPHHPFTPPGRYWDMYDPERIPLPDSFGKGDLPPLAWLRETLRKSEAIRNSQDPFAVTEREAREIIALTYGMISMVDDAIGRVLAKLDTTGLADDTVVLFTADHGDFMGDHGIMLKMLLHYHGLIRIPFLWADPGAPSAAAARDDLAATIDIPSTVLARAGLQPFNGVQGRDLFDADTASPDGLMIEEDAQRSMIGMKPPMRVRTYVTNRWRMSIREDADWGELFDLENDPLEIANRWDDPSARDVRAELFERMARRMMELQDRSPFPTGRA